MSEQQPSRSYFKVGIFFVLIFLCLFFLMALEGLGLWYFWPKAAGPVPNAATTWTRPTDDMLMVFVPAGSFPMGSSNGPTNEKPIHTVSLDAFWIDRTDVTNSEYALCVLDGGCEAPTTTYDPDFDHYNQPNFENFPVVNVDWDQANDYCTWVHGRLPSEAEWEKAARGTDGRAYPWGETLDKTYANYGMNNNGTTAVCSFPKGNSPYGACDMTGNVWQWTGDWYSGAYYQDSPIYNPTGPKNGIARALRGGSWNRNGSMTASTRFSLSPGRYEATVGFRCVIGLAPQKTTGLFGRDSLLGFRLP